VEVKPRTVINPLFMAIILPAYEHLLKESFFRKLAIFFNLNPIYGFLGMIYGFFVRFMAFCFRLWLFFRKKEL
jgi:hypothetical protein